MSLWYFRLRDLEAKGYVQALRGTGVILEEINRGSSL
jgi:hypothetical protein